MKKRNRSMLVFYTDDEFNDLKEKAAAAGLSRSEFVRRAVAGKEVKQAPAADIPILIRDIRRAGANVDQLLKIANATHLVDAPQMRKVLVETEDGPVNLSIHIDKAEQLRRAGKLLKLYTVHGYIVAYEVISHEGT